MTTKQQVEAGSSCRGDGERSDPRPVSLRSNRTFACALGLVALCFLAYANAIPGYFVCDDFQLLRFAHTVYERGWSMLYVIFCTPVAEIQPYLKCYRPLPDLIWIGEYLAFGAQSAVGFHLTNISIHAVATLLIFAIGRKFFPSPNLLPSFFAAALYAVYPGYGEVMCGPTNMVTATGAMFCLASLAAFLYNRPRLSVLLFACSILCKENGAALPVVLAVIAWKRDKRASLPYWLVLVAYAAARAAVIGPVLGGYGGPLANGAALTNPWPQYLLIPVNNCIFAAHNDTRQLILCCYLALIAFATTNIFNKSFVHNARRIAILTLATAAAFATVMPAWNLEQSLAGGRHFYLVAAPISLLIILTTYNARFKTIWAAALAAMVALFLYVDTENNHAYIEASNQDANLKRAYIAAVDALPKEDKIVLVNPPYGQNGLYLFATAYMFDAFCNEPTLDAAHARRDGLRSLWTNRTYDTIDELPLKKLLSNPHNRLARWNSGDQSITYLQRSIVGAPHTALTPVYVHRDQSNQVSVQKFFLSREQLQPASTIECDLTTSPIIPVPNVQPAISVWWQTDEKPDFDPRQALYLPVIADGKPHHYTFTVGTQFKWWLSEQNGCFEIRLPSPQFRNQLSNVQIRCSSPD